MRSVILYLKPLAILLLFISLVSCGSKNGQTNTDSSQKKVSINVTVPELNADTAFRYVQKQIDFGYRITGTDAHTKCSRWIVTKLTAAGAKVTEQKFPAIVNEKQVEGRNIVAQFFPEHKKRIMLSAHYDTRNIADRDPIAANHTKPVPGANDGASGVGVLLAIADAIHEKDPGVGIDLFFWDAEDYGGNGVDESWCQGSQYWAHHPNIKNYTPRYGILLDMVGADGAQFTQEGFSRQYAQPVLTKIWQTAHRIGQGGYFLFAPDNDMIDDHLYLNKVAGIPTIDIIHRDLNTNDFFMHHHRVTDDMKNIRKETLKAVGQTLLQVLYEEGATR